MQGKQGSLFDQLPLPEEMTQQVRIAGSSTQLDPAQRAFNRLSNEVGRLQEEIQRWQQRIALLGQRLQDEMLPQLNRLRQAQKDLAMQLDALLSMPKGKLRLSNGKRQTLSSYICLLTEEMLNIEADPEITALRERHLGMSRQEEAELEHALAREMLGSMFGEDALEGFEGEDVEEMIDHAWARHGQKQIARTQGRRRTKKELALEEAKEAADTALREAYRKLASHLHPDRERNADEQKRKTDLMQQANAAYEKRDLMGLLRLQLECAQIDADSLGELPEARIKRFNHALREQVQTLKREKEGLVQAVAELLDVDGWSLATVQDARLDALFDDRLEALQRTIKHVQGLAANLATPSRRDVAIKSILSEMDDMLAEPEFDALAALLMSTEDAVADGPAPARRRGKKRKAR